MSTQQKPLLRVMTAGSVDDGKSTLIGRLLYDSKAVLADQLRAISQSRFQRTTDGSLDLSLLTDGLEAEREQGITIDVAYRYFSTAKRKFVLADAPGHEQYTRNMVTAASTAQVMIMLVDAYRVRDGNLLTQTKRHAAIAKWLNVPHIIVAVNKMDMLGYDEAAFADIAKAYHALAAHLEIPMPTLIPLSALTGDNVTRKSAAMPWYEGPNLLELLENIPTAQPALANAGPLRIPVQWVVRAEGSSANAFRGLAGRIARGTLSVGDEVGLADRREITARVAQIRIGERRLERAVAGLSVCIVLDRQVDVSRGDTLIHAHTPTALRSQFAADICWLDTQPLQCARKYWLKHGTRTSYARVCALHSVLDVPTLTPTPTDGTLTLNALGKVEIEMQNGLVADRYDEHVETGAFILIDPASHQTVAAGLVR